MWLFVFVRPVKMTGGLCLQDESGSNPFKMEGFLRALAAFGSVFSKNQKRIMMSDFFQEVMTQMQMLHWSEWGAVLLALVYLVLAARNDIRCWIWGGLSCVLWAWAAFSLYRLYVDALLQVFYVLMSVWGWWTWKSGGGGQGLPITRMSRGEHLVLLFGGSLLSWLVGYLFAQHTDAAVPYLDAFTTVFSVLTTFLVIFRKLENWLYWLVIDTVYIYQYGSRGGYLFALLFALYLFLAWVGYQKWKKSLPME